MLINYNPSAPKYLIAVSHEMVLYHFWMHFVIPLRPVRINKSYVNDKIKNKTFFLEQVIHSLPPPPSPRSPPRLHNKSIAFHQNVYCGDPHFLAKVNDLVTHYSCLVVGLVGI